ncbi:MAG: hypothetical protein HFK03_06420 [Clostridia bacterium]|jgi:hypothetical protein|nr:hypothetical protein [Clostridia bacterium]
MKKKVINYLITIILIFTLVFTSGFFCACQKKPDPNPVLPVDPNPPTPNVENKNYKLHNWYAEMGVGVPRITLTENNYSSITFPVPQREHFTFNGWYMGEDKVADENGKSLMTKQLFESDNTDITAKFTANQTFTYKILLVFVTRIDAVLPTCDKTSTIHVDYTMRDLERELCELTVIRLKEKMDDMMDGLVDFQIDGYFTTEPAVTENFRQTGYGDNKLYNSLFPVDIPEVKEMLINYDSYISVFSMDDFSYKLHNASGAAWIKYGEVNLDSHLSAFSSNNNEDTIMRRLKDAVEVFRNNNDKDRNEWIILDGWIDTIIHETAHTIELRVNLFEFHKVSGSFRFKFDISDLEAKKYYYLKQSIAEGQNVGIPYEFWKGEIAQVDYLFTDGGTVNEENIESQYIGHKEVLYGTEISVYAVPRKGYKFVKWSDGLEADYRTDKILGDFTVTAIFEPKKYNLTVVASEGGQIGGYGNPSGDYTLLTDGDSLYIQAIADDGYRFVGWSDGETKWSRYFKISASNVDLFDNNSSYTLTALFEKI